MLGFGAKKKRSVENWRRRARWIDLQKTRVIIINPEIPSPVDNSKIKISTAYSQNVPYVGDSSNIGLTLHQMEEYDDFSSTSVSFREIYSADLRRSFEKEIDVRNLGKNAVNKWIIRALKNLPPRTK